MTLIFLKMSAIMIFISCMLRAWGVGWVERGAQVSMDAALISFFVCLSAICIIEAIGKKDKP